MSKEHADLLREMYDRRTLEAFAESLHPEAEMHQASVVPDTDDYYGRDEFLRGTRRFNEEWAELRYIPEEVIDLGERVLVRVHLVGRAKSSGVKADLTAFHLWTFREGMPWRCDVFVDEEGALEAARTTE
jgi:hypothetical protein